VSGQKVKLSDIGSISRGRSKHRPRNAPELYGGEYPFVQTADVKNADLYLTSYTQTYNEAGLAQSKLWPKGTMCITIAANIADTCILGIDACFPDSIIGFIPDTLKCDIKYIKYKFDFDVQRQYQQMSQGATQDNLSQEKLLSFQFEIPSLDIQKRVASILAAYDDLIGNNCRRVVLLEKMAHELYREHFARNKVHGTSSTIGEIIRENLKSHINAGVGRNSSGTIPFYTSGASVYLCDQKLVDGANLFLNTGGNSDVKLHIGEASYSTDTWSITCSETLIYYLYFFLKELNDSGELFNSYFKGATIQHLQKKDFRKINIELPSDQKLLEFNRSVSLMIVETINLKRQILKLRLIRDRLLPRLMGGKVDLDKLVKEEVENG